MRRSVARGRIVPQSLSTDPRMGQLSLKAALLFPLMWINCDDQGRVSGNPHEIKYACCPNIDHITKTDIAELLEELQEQGLVKVYTTTKTKAIQMLDWWDVQKLQWAYPSEYPSPEEWQDHLRYHPTPKEIITENWPPSGQQASELLPSALPSAPANSLPSAEGVGRDSSLDTREDLLEDIIIWGPPITRDTKPRERHHQFILLSFKSMTPLGFDFNEGNLSTLVTDIIGESHLADFPSSPFHKVIETSFGLIQGSSFSDWESLFSHIQSIPQMAQKCIILERLIDIENEKEKERGKRRGRGILPSALGSNSSPSPRAPPSEIQILHRLTECFKREWGRVPAESPEKVILREPTAKESAQLRDLARELSSAGGCPLETIDEAFRDVAGQPQPKMKITYVRAILLDWLGLERGPPG